MQIAVISDIHGNWPALSVVTDEISALGVDQVICLGDVVNPLPSSTRVLEYLMKQKIPTIRGNHEDYIITAFENPENDINHLPQFRPIHLVSKSFNFKQIEQLKSLPMTLQINSPLAGELLLCHASPSANNKGWIFGVDENLSQELNNEQAATIVCGHWHDPRTTLWNSKTLIANGSVGLPLSGKPRAEFLVLEDTKDGWSHKHLSVPYNSEEAIREYVQSGWFAAGGPMAWILLCELVTAKRQVSRFFQWAHQNQIQKNTEDEWVIAVETFLRQGGDWTAIDSYIL